MAPKMHMKGRLLQLLLEGPQWDYELGQRICQEYEEADGEYWANTVRLTLADLHSGGLVQPVEEAVDTSKTYGVEKVVFRFELSDFGRQRMEESGLLTGAGARGGR